MLDDFGTLSVRTYTAGDALPVPRASVRIFGAEEANRFSVHSLLTDENGISPTVSLPAPNRKYSLEPHPDEPPYAIYDIEVNADGYLPRLLRSVPIFGGVYSLQPVSLVPTSVKEIY